MTDWYAVVEHLGLPLAMLGLILWRVFPWMAKQLWLANEERQGQTAAFLKNLQERDEARRESQAAFLQALRERDQMLKDVLSAHNDVIHRSTERLTEIHTMLQTAPCGPNGVWPQPLPRQRRKQPS
jgi:hypothetical protein